MKIVQIVPQFGIGGAEIMCENLSFELKKLGNNVFIISLYNSRSLITERMEANGLKLIFLDKKSGLDIGLLKSLRTILIEIKPDVIHTHLYALKYAVLASLNMDIPMFHTLHNIASKESSFLNIQANKVFYRRGLVQPVALNDTVKATAEKIYKMSKLPVVFNGVPLGKCIIKKDYSSYGDFKILHIGRFSEQKNHLELLKAIKMLVDQDVQIKLTLVGDGELKSSAVEYVVENKLNNSVRFAGITDDVFSFLGEADLFVLPSKYEGMPMTLIEAMGCGLPIVAGNVGGIPCMIEDSVSGLLCEPTAESIRKQIMRMVNSSELRKTCGENAVDIAKQYSAENMALNYMNLYGSKRDSYEN